jgi:hypothetical protein
MDSLTESVQKYMQVTSDCNKSLSKYITTIIELVEVGCPKEIVLKHLHNVQKVLHNLQRKDDGQSS